MWIAVRIERGFPVEAVAFRDRRAAARQESRWRRRMNPDYDETGVLPLAIG
jgi:hypothetical protein